MGGRDPERTIVLQLVLATARRADIQDDLERLVYDLGTFVILHEMEGFDHYFRVPHDPGAFAQIAGLLRAAGAPNLEPLQRMHDLIGQLVPSRDPGEVDACFCEQVDDDLFAATERWGDQFYERVDLMWKHIDRHLRSQHRVALKAW